MSNVEEEGGAAIIEQRAFSNKLENCAGRVGRDKIKECEEKVVDRHVECAVGEVGGVFDGVEKGLSVGEVGAVEKGARGCWREKRRIDVAKAAGYADEEKGKEKEKRKNLGM